MPVFETNDHVRLHYTDAGEGPAVILVAGFLAPATSWVLQEQALVAGGFRVIAFDRRNHGESAAVAHGQRLARHGQDLAELLDALELSEAFLVGGSMGASTIWAYLDLHGYDRVLGVVSVDQTPKMINTDDWAHGFYGLTPDNVGTFFDQGIPDTGRGQTQDRLMVGLQNLVAALGSVPKFGTAGDPQTRPLLQDHAEKDWRDVIRRTERPILLVAGDQSQFWPSEHASSLAEEIELVSAEVIADAGHATNLDQPDTFNIGLLAFLVTHAP